MTNVKKTSSIPLIVNLSSQHLLSIEGMNKSEILSILDRADYFADVEVLK